MRPDLLDAGRGQSWRQEVASRVNSYRSRKQPQTPRRPSLQLEFETPPSAAPSYVKASAVSGPDPVPLLPSGPPPIERASLPARPEVATKIIEFPRSASAFQTPDDELAEAVEDRLRIIEAPDIGPPLPALGGILIDGRPKTTAARADDNDVQLLPAAVGQRALAGAVDFTIVLLAAAVFALVASLMVPVGVPLAQFLGLMTGATPVFWCMYLYLLLVYSGTTPGMQLARLHLSQFDGRAVPRCRRRWRVFASLLSGVSLGLGFLWCFLDEDQLSWHDRMTRTYLTSAEQS